MNGDQVDWDYEDGPVVSLTAPFLQFANVISVLEVEVIGMHI